MKHERNPRRFPSWPSAAALRPHQISKDAIVYTTPNIKTTVFAMHKAFYDNAVRTREYA